MGRMPQNAIDLLSEENVLPHPLRRGGHPRATDVVLSCQPLIGGVDGSGASSRRPGLSAHIDARFFLSLSSVQKPVKNEPEL